MIDVSWRTRILFISCLCRSSRRAADWLAFGKTSAGVPRERQSHLTADRQSLLAISLLSLLLAVYVNSDKMTLYAMSIHAGINQRCHHQNVLGKLNRILKREDWYFFLQFLHLFSVYITIIVCQVGLFAAGSHSWKKMWALDLKFSVRISFILRGSTHISCLNYDKIQFLYFFSSELIQSTTKPLI